MLMQNNNENTTAGKTKAGYAAIIGKPNAGKSTLLNSIIGTKLSIITPKPQTTRKRVLGICTEGNTQIVFIDTPGVLNPKYEMQSNMMGYVHASIEEADCIILIYDVTKFNVSQPIPPELHNFFKDENKPIILLLNKIDLLKDSKDVLPLIKYFDESKMFKEIVPISALKEKQLYKRIINIISNYMPEGEFFYDEDLLSTQPERFFVSEIIRENIFLSYSDEVPYSTEVAIVEFKEREFGKWFINAEIIVERDTQKKIIIGKDGEKLKRILEISRKQIEEHLDHPVYLEAFVKVRDKWRDKPNMLRSFGY